MPVRTLPKQYIPKDLLHDALLNPPISVVRERDGRCSR